MEVNLKATKNKLNLKIENADINDNWTMDV